MKRKQHLQSFLSVCNKRLLSATARHAGKRPSEQFAHGDIRVTPQKVLMTPHLKKLTGTLQFNTTQFGAFLFGVTRTTGNPVHALWSV